MSKIPPKNLFILIIDANLSFNVFCNEWNFLCNPKIGFKTFNLFSNKCLGNVWKKLNSTWFQSTNIKRLKLYYHFLLRSIRRYFLVFLTCNKNRELKVWTDVVVTAFLFKQRHFALNITKLFQELFSVLIILQTVAIINHQIQLFL